MLSPPVPPPPERPPPIVSPRAATAIAGLVATVWAASMLGDVFVKAYDPNPMVHAAMMLVLGTVFGVQVVRK